MKYISTIIIWTVIAIVGAAFISGFWSDFMRIISGRPIRVSWISGILIRTIFLVGFIFLAKFALSQPHDYWWQGYRLFVGFLSEHRKWIFWGIGLSIFGLVTMGMPGMLILSGMDFVLNKSFFWARGSNMHGDAVWPLAIFYSLSSPWIAFGVYLLLRKRIYPFGDLFAAISIVSISTLLLFIIHTLVRIINRT